MQTLRQLTFTYKQVGSIKIDVDVYIPPSIDHHQGNQSRMPVLYWLHGGGLTNGGRSKPYPHLLRGIVDNGMIGVFPDYRLAPQVIYPDILSDVADSFKWTVDELPHLLEQAMPLGPNVDPRRIVVMGSSAGGFLALNLVLGRNPSLPLHNTRMVWDYLRKVAGVVAIYPQTKLNDPFYTHKNPNPFRGPLTGEEQLQLDGFLSSRKVCTNTHAGQAQERNNLFRYCQQIGCLQNVLFASAGTSPEYITQDFDNAIKQTDLPQWVRHHTDYFRTCKEPWGRLSIYLIHGTEDLAVPLNQTLSLQQALKAATVPVQVELVPGQDHVFDAEEQVQLPHLWKFVRDRSDQYLENEDDDDEI